MTLISRVESARVLFLMECCFLEVESVVSYVGRNILFYSFRQYLRCAQWRSQGWKIVGQKSVQQQGLENVLLTIPLKIWGNSLFC